MPKDSFTFKHFTIRQDKCAMKVGTDGVMLGAWARGGKRILDIGTGTGIVAMMMAQRYPNARITAVEYEPNAADQAADNCRTSVFGDRMDVVCQRFQDFAAEYNGSFDAIVCNPPFFYRSKLSAEKRRAMARHEKSLPFDELLRGCRKLIADDGRLSLILPSAAFSRLDIEALAQGLLLQRQVVISSVDGKRPFRKLLEYGFQLQRDLDTQTEYIATTDGRRSEWYQKLTEDFYLNN